MTVEVGHSLYQSLPRLWHRMRHGRVLGDTPANGGAQQGSSEEQPRRLARHVLAEDAVSSVLLFSEEGTVWRSLFVLGSGAVSLLLNFGGARASRKVCVRKPTPSTERRMMSGSSESKGLRQVHIPSGVDILSRATSSEDRMSARAATYCSSGVALVGYEGRALHSCSLI